MTITASGVAELREAIQRFIALTELGIRACDSHDPDALVGALQAREIVTLRVGESSRWLRSSGRSRADLDDLAAHAQEAARLNHELAQRAMVLRDDIRLQLDRVNHDDTAIGAYSATSPRVAQLDSRR